MSDVAVRITPSRRVRLSTSKARLVAMLLAVATLAAAVFVDVRIEPPRVRVEWAASVDADTRASLEQAYGLVDARRFESANEPRLSGNTWSYRLVSPRSAQATRIFTDTRIVELQGVDRQRRTLPSTRFALGWRAARELRDVAQRQSGVVLIGAFLLGIMSLARSRRVRLGGAMAAIVALAVVMIRMPVEQPMRMGDFETYVASRGNFDLYLAGPTVRFEAHLSSLLLRILDRQLGGNAQARAFERLGQCASLWFAAMLLVAGWTLGWSPSALRYMALATATPATLMFFGYRELGYLSLNPAAFPLIVKGIQGVRRRFVAGSVLYGLGAALHAFGLLSLIGTALSTVASRIRVKDRVILVLQAFAFGTSAYLIWLFIYLAVMHLSVTPGHAQQVPLRPLAVSRLIDHRVDYAVLSVEGLADALASSWITGAWLLGAAVVVSRTRLRAAIVVAAFCLPSVIFLWAFWPVQGVAVEADLIFGAFPAVYALAWLAAQRLSVTIWSIIMFASGHAVFWRVMLGDFFVNSRVY
jgi:hypothetical protein